MTFPISLKAPTEWVICSSVGGATSGQNNPRNFPAGSQASNENAGIFREPQGAPPNHQAATGAANVK